MTILHVINKLDGGGAEKLLSELLPLIKAGDCHVTLLVLSSEGDRFSKLLIENGVEVLFLTASPRLYSVKLFLRVLKKIKNYDLVHVHLFPAQYYVAIASLFSRRKMPIVTTEHSTHNSRMEHTILRPLEKFVYSRFSKIISISTATQYKLKTWLKTGDNKNRFLVIENGIQLQRYKQAIPYPKRKLHSLISEEDVVLIMVARFDVAKDHHTLIRAMKLLPSTYKLVLVGTGPLLNSTTDFVKAEGLDQRIIFLGYRTDVNRLLKSADVFVLSSNWDGFGLVAVEAMAAGIPVLVSEVEGLKEVMGEAGNLFRSGDHSMLAEKVKEIVCNPNKGMLLLKQRMRAEQFNIDQVAIRHVNLYRELII